ncbi:MAG: hypothetical protein ACLFV2_10980 [Desulfurivibrionaceae bacterium]
MVYVQSFPEREDYLVLQDSLNLMLNWFLDVRSENLDAEGEHRPAEFAAHLSKVYNLVKYNQEHLDNKAVKSVSQFDPSPYINSEDYEYLKNVLEIRDYFLQEVRDYFERFILHGSLATLDYSKGWSDVDIFAVIRDKVMSSPQNLLELRRKTLILRKMFYNITLFQHHGLMIVTSADLRCYPTHYLPPKVLDFSWEFLPIEYPVEFYIQPSSDNKVSLERRLMSRKKAVDEAIETGVYKHHPYNGEPLMARFKNAENAMYQLFCFLNSVMIMPAFLLDAIGRGCYKKESFTLARPYFSDEAWSLVDRASRIRSEWELREYNLFHGNAVPEWVMEMLGFDYIEKFSKLLGEILLVIEQEHNDEE